MCFGDPLTLSEERHETDVGCRGTHTQKARSDDAALLLATVLHDARAAVRPTRRGDTWVLEARASQSGVTYNTYVYASLSQTLTIDLVTRHAHLVTSSYVDTTS